jgi:predicted aconitase
MDEIINSGLKAPYGFTLDPRPLDYKNVKANVLEKLVFNKFMYAKQKDYEEQLKKVGLKNENAFSCTCYLEEVGNTPKKGEVIGWAESSAVVFANSVLGARCNRNSGMIDLFQSLAGRALNYGLVTDEGRKATWIIEVKTTKKPEAQILGSAIGMKVVEDVPYIKGLDKFLGNEINNDILGYLKDMGAASASNGAVGLYHVENLTPEAKELGEKLIKKDAKTYVIDDNEIERVYNSYPVMWKDKDAKPGLCFIGCPHLTYNQLEDWTDKITSSLKENNRTKIAVRSILTTSPDVLDKFKKTEKYNQLIATGVKISNICPLMYTNNPLTHKKPIATNSNKLRTYSIARYYKDSAMIDIISGKEAK